MNWRFSLLNITFTMPKASSLNALRICIPIYIMTCTNLGVGVGVREPAVGAGAHVRHPALAVRGAGYPPPRARRNPRPLTELRP